MLVLTIVFLFAAVNAIDHRKIVGGDEALIEDFPYQAFVTINSRSFSQFCGASILDESTLLTAAHCWEDDDSDELEGSYVRVGSTDKYEGGQQINVARAIVHPDYDETTTANDIAIIKLDGEIYFDNNVQPISIAESLPPVGSMVSIAGWGALAESDEELPDTLYSIDVPIIDKQLCRDFYEDNEYSIDANTFCAGDINGGTDACQGDSGGPAVFDGEQIGIVSWGEGCAREEKVTIYTDVTKFQSFISEYL